MRDFFLENFQLSKLIFLSFFSETFWYSFQNLRDFYFIFKTKIFMFFIESFWCSSQIWGFCYFKNSNAAVWFLSNSSNLTVRKAASVSLRFVSCSHQTWNRQNQYILIPSRQADEDAADGGRTRRCTDTRTGECSLNVSVAETLRQHLSLLDSKKETGKTETLWLI